jgi:hypothetical protein
MLVKIYLLLAQRTPQFLGCLSWGHIEGSRIKDSGSKILEEGGCLKNMEKQLGI